jgi:phosphoglucosamine mutase
MYDEVPQKLHNIKYSGKNPLDVEEVDIFIRRISEETGRDGRILVRKSGTEPLIRVMVEHKSETKMDEILEKIVAKIKLFL